jgi:hypothetical protein
MAAGLVSGPDMSQARTCLKVRGQMFRAESVSRPEESKSLGLEVSRGRNWLEAGSVLELQGSGSKKIRQFDIFGIY